ncbi:group III truncated hemoglobin [Parahaliea sp. F7430]|uniref:Group III truncated hemoglobin n=1 Tax=Sediminihaliea albiluteola TaxID=2758564 RepID=A0A7W2TVF4_9GAMM|nr:group III truncated hemoglobin [Sediminihaliea albiluteola]MBA6412658.1 group III truncated hemoglobin [Sediminihaliea albiluteola]
MSATPTEKVDLDSRDNIERFVESFYARMLKDEQLAPIFWDVAQIDLDVHLPHIKDYWCKLLLGETKYQRHTMNIHRQLNDKRSLLPADFERWLALFMQSLEADFSGPKTERAKRVATSIAKNMQNSLSP